MLKTILWHKNFFNALKRQRNRYILPVNEVRIRSKSLSCENPSNSVLPSPRQNACILTSVITCACPLQLIVKFHSIIQCHGSVPAAAGVKVLQTNRLSIPTIFLKLCHAFVESVK